jgi:hypothetical protein
MNLARVKLNAGMGICSLIICFSLLRSRLCSVSGGVGVASCSWRPGTPSFRGILRQVPPPVLSIGFPRLSLRVLLGERSAT